MDFVYAVRCMPEAERNILLDLYKSRSAETMFSESNEVNRSKVEEAKNLVALGMITCRHSTYNATFYLRLTPSGAQTAAYYLICWDRA